MRRPENTLELVQRVLQRLREAQVEVWLAGGWAEEVRGLRPAGLHGDIDLWYPGANFVRVDQWLAHEDDLVEIAAKRFSHKRAFLYEGVMIEVLLLQPREGGLITRFFDGGYALMWPKETLGDVQVGGQRLAVASVQALKQYREHHPHIAQAYQAFLSQV